MEEYKCLGFKPDKILYSVTVMLLFKQNKAEMKSFKCFFGKVFKHMYVVERLCTSAVSCGEAASEQTTHSG